MIAVPEMLRFLGDRLQTAASTRAVYGEPVTVGGRTVIPIARIGYGFGAGGGDQGEKGGAGGGAGIGARPVGALEITEGGTRFIPFVDPLRLGLALAAAVLIGVAIGRRLMRSG